MVHDMAMTVLQLVRREAPDGAVVFDAVDNRDGREPRSFQGGGQHPLVLGSQDMIELCVQLIPFGFKPISIMLVDATLTAIEDPDQATEYELISKLKSGDPNAALKFLWEEMDGIYLLQITMRGPQNVQVTLTQNGLVRTPNASVTVDPLLKAVKRWQTH